MGAASSIGWLGSALEKGEELRADPPLIHLERSQTKWLKTSLGRCPIQEESPGQAQDMLEWF